jgi:DNA-3-methyladenine glycosylase I
MAERAGAGIRGFEPGLGGHGRRSATYHARVGDGTEGCGWGVGSPEMRAYHDEEWGVPVRDDNALYERLVLEGAQSGLSWALILSKRSGYRRLFCGFDPAVVARFDEDDVERLMLDAGIVRNRAKITAAISNARLVETMHGAGESLSELLWSFTDGKTHHNAWRALEELPAVTPTSAAMSTELRRRGFRFVGPTTCYATLQAAGMVNDHLVTCPRWRELGGGSHDGPERAGMTESPGPGS